MVLLKPLASYTSSSMFILEKYFVKLLSTGSGPSVKKCLVKAFTTFYLVQLLLKKVFYILSEKIIY